MLIGLTVATYFRNNLGFYDFFHGVFDVDIDFCWGSYQLGYFV